MAKQRVSVVEQHIEKIVLGICSLVFLAVTFLYVVSSPVVVTVQGQPVPADEVDRRLVDLAEQLRRAVQRAKPTPKPVQRYAEVLKKYQQQGPLEDLPGYLPLAVAFAPKFEVPPELGVQVAEKHDIAPVIAPEVAEVYSGVAYFPVPEPQSLAPEAAGTSASPTALQQAQAEGQLKDVVWTFVRLKFDMSRQYETFRQHHYTPELASTVLFLDVQLQRQRVYPDGSTGPWEDVQILRTVRVEYPQTVRIDTSGSLNPQDANRIMNLLSLLEKHQQDLLFPIPPPPPDQFIQQCDLYPPYGVPTLVFAAEAQMPGAAAGMTGRPAAPARQPAVTRRPARAARRTGRAGRGGERGGGGERFDRGGERPTGGGRRTARQAGLDTARMAQMSQLLREAERAFKEKRYAEARSLVNQVVQSGLPGLQRRAVELQLKIEQEYQKWLEMQQKRLERLQQEEATKQEIWAYDISAEPGKTYRYRARVVLFNVFAHPDVNRDELVDPAAAQKVALLGEWSQPSKPVTVADNRRFYLVGTDQRQGLATVEVFRFQQGQWYKEQFRVGIGDEIGKVFKKNLLGRTVDVDFRTGKVVVDIDYDRPVGRVSKTAGGTGFRLMVSRSSVLIYMDEDGAIYQRWAVLDRADQVRKELAARASQQVTPLLPTAGAYVP